VQRSKLRLDNLPLKLTDKDTAATWAKVFDRVSRGEMPPRSKDRPPEKETRATLDTLQKHLHDASLAKQQMDGRVVLRSSTASNTKRHFATCSGAMSK